MKSLVVTLLLTLSFSATAHVGGHQKENIFTPKFGGTLAKIEKPSTSALVAELAADGKKGLFLFLYDRKMKLVTSSASKAKVSGKITSGRGKRVQNLNVDFTHSNDRFKVKLPNIKKRPYSIAININQNGKVSTVTFNNVD